MISKVAINKKEINRLIRLNKLDEAREYFVHAKDMLELTIKTKIDKLIENEIILAKEREAFYLVFARQINNKFLEDKDYILIDESYIEKERERIEKIHDLKSKNHHNLVSLH